MGRAFTVSSDKSLGNAINPKPIDQAASGSIGRLLPRFKPGSLAGLMLALIVGWTQPAGAGELPKLIETPSLEAEIAAGKLPAVADRIPQEPLIVNLTGDEIIPGKHGGTLNLLMGRSKDIRMMVVYGYARLVGYNRSFEIEADIVKAFDNQDDKVFTFHLRDGHRWSDGHPFTAEDFRYYWEDMALDQVISPKGPPEVFYVEGELPKFEVIDAKTVRYSWHKPNPTFLAKLAGASPLYIYRPAHYLRQFHAKHTDQTALDSAVKDAGKRDWRDLHFSKDRLYAKDNIAQPNLQPWINTTAPPSDRFIFTRNPFFHRIDGNGRQLPYIDRVAIGITSSGLVPAKVSAGESDLQARGLEFKNYTILKRGEERNNYNVRLWKSGRGNQMVLIPNLNSSDANWRNLLRDVRFRRALSLSIDREQINQVLFFGLAEPAANTVLPVSPLFKPEYREAAIEYDADTANALLDELGLTEKDDNGVRKLPNGEPLEIIVETAGESSDEADILEIIRSTWLDCGIKLFTKPTEREVLRRRVMAGETVMSTWWGLDNGVATANYAPYELAPTADDQLLWMQWGFHHITRGQSGQAPDMPEGKRLLELYKEWTATSNSARRHAIWEEMLTIHAESVLTIGTVAGVPQPVVVRKTLRNVPAEGLYNWDPGAHFGIYHLDQAWFE